MMHNNVAVHACKENASCRSISSLGGSFIQANADNMSLGAKVSMSAVIGGTAEKLGGGKFANGAVTGAYVMMFNHLSTQHQSQKHSNIWDEFPVKDYASLNDNERVEHIFDAIRHTKDHGIDPEVPLDKIFTNLKSVSTLQNGGINIKYAQVIIESQNYEVMISIDLWNSTKHKNFLGTKVLFGGYGKVPIATRPGWYRSYNPGEYQIGVNGYENYINIMSWLGIH
jgi:hypothetical protein